MVTSRPVMGAILALVMTMPVKAQTSAPPMANPVSPQTSNPAPPGTLVARDYAVLVEMVRKGEVVDGAELRAAYAASPGYNPFFGRGDANTRLDQAAKVDDANAMLQAATQLLDEAYVNAKAHFGAAAAHRKLGDEAQAERHMAIGNGLMNAMIERTRRSGPETGGQPAVVVIGMAEPAFFAEALGQQAISGTPITSRNGRAYLRMTVRSPEGVVKNMLFDITYPAEMARRASMPITPGTTSVPSAPGEAPALQGNPVR